MLVIPLAFAGTKQKEWGRKYRCPEAYKRIDQWCAQNGHGELVACLAELHQQMRMASIYLASKEKDLRILTFELLPLVKSHHRHRSTSLRNRMDLLNRHLRYLVAAGLADRGRGWARFVDATEARVIRLQPYKRKRRFDGKIAPQVQNTGDVDGNRLKILRGAVGQRRRRAGHQAWRTQQRDCNGNFGAQVGPQKKKNIPLQPLPPQVVEPQRSAPPAVPEVAGGVLIFALDLPDAERLVRYGALSRQQGCLSPAQDADFTAILDREEARKAALPPPAPEPPPPRPAQQPVSPPPRAARTAAGVQVPAGATRAHERTLDALAEKLGVPLGEADEAALCLQPATPAQLVAAVPALSFYPHLPEKLAARGLSVAACHHGYAGVAGSLIALRGDVVALTITGAKRTQQYFVGDAEGWNPYGGYLRAKQQNNARGGLRRRPP